MCAEIKVDDLFFFVFGITMDECGNNDKSKNACADKAYLDLCRTLDYELNSSQCDKKENEFFKDAKFEFRKKGCKIIITAIDNYPSVQSGESGYKSFDDWHKNLTKLLLCETRDFSISFFQEKKNSFFKKEIIKENDIGENICCGLTIGQAQKWINMTIKYMRIMSILNENIPESAIHIPIDDYILSAASKPENSRISDAYDICGLNIKKSEYNISEWSKITCYDDYLNYQQTIRNKAGEELEINPIDWEAKAWIAESVYRPNNKNE